MSNEIESSMGNSELTPLQQEGIELYKEVQETETAFREAVEILSALDREENRKKLAKNLNQMGYSEITASDFENCSLLPLKRKDLQEEFGVSFFPLTVVVPVEKWSLFYAKNPRTGEIRDIMDELARMGAQAEKQQPALLNQLDKSGYKIFDGAELNHKFDDALQLHSVTIAGGLYISPDRNCEHPFDKVGISFMSEKYIKEYGITAHEELHKVYQIYSPFSWQSDEIMAEYESDPKSVSLEGLRDVLERDIINEINTSRDNVKSGDMVWYSPKGSHQKSVSYFLEKLRIGYYQEARGLENVDIEEKKMYQACQTMDYLQKHLPESVLTHILLNCKNLDDLNAWSKFKPEELQDLGIKI